MSIQCSTFTRVLRLRLKDKHARALREHAYWVNQVWNYCNELSSKVLQREHRFLSGFDLQKYTAGATREGLPLHSQTVQAIAEEYALRRKQFKKTKLRWRVSNPKSSKYSLGWIPFKAAALRYRNGQVHFSGLGPLSLWDSYGLSNFELGPGSFSEDARGRYKRTRLDKFGFPRGYLTRQKAVKGFQTGDLVRAEVPASSKKAGTYIGRVAIRATGSFNSYARPP